MKLHINNSGFCEGKVILSQRETSGKLNYFLALTDLPVLGIK